MAWLGEFDLKDISLTNICDKVFEILENQFDIDVTKFFISLIIASRYGIQESEMYDLLHRSKLVKSMLIRKKRNAKLLQLFIFQDIPRVYGLNSAGLRDQC